MSENSIQEESGLKAVVVVPPVFDFYYTPHRSSGLGAAVVCNLIRTKGLQVRLLNFPGQARKVKKRNLPPELNYLAPYLIAKERGKISFFNHYKRFGPSIGECARQILSTSPDLVFISCFAFCYAQSALDLARQIRKSDLRPMIILGGAGVSAHPDFFIDNPNVDFAFTGEAEVSLPVFLDIVIAGSPDFSRVPNLYRKNRGRIIVPERAKFTAPEEIVFVLNKTFETSTAVFFTTTLSRGCPKACRFCSNFLSHGRDFRTIPPAQIKKGLAAPVTDGIASHKKVYVNFEDDNFLCDPSYFFSVLDIFKSVFPDVGFLAENGIDYTLITPEILEKLIQYGMKQFNLSMVSADPELLEHEKRKAGPEKYENITGILKTHDIPCVTYFICGLKNDTREKVLETICYLAGHPTRVGISLFYPVPGIPGFQDKSFFAKISPCLCAGSSAFPWNRSLTTSEMITAFRLCRFVNLLKSVNRTANDELMIERSFQEQSLFSLVGTGDDAALIRVTDMDFEMVDLFFRKISAPNDVCR